MPLGHGDEQQHEALAGRSKQAQEVASHQNALLPISRLPVEVLGEIFHCNRDSDPDTSPFKRFKAHELHWIVVTWVCRRWRAVALDDLTLWSRLPMYPSKWSPIMLERVKDAPFSADLTELLTPGCDDLVARILARLAQLETLTAICWGLKTDKFHTLFSNFNMSTPNLKALCLKQCCPTLVEAPVISDTAFSRAPLRSLHLYQVGISWTSHLFSGSLLTLKLAELQRRHRPTIHDLQSLSRKLTNLRSLTLRQSFPSTQDIPAHSDVNKITFLRLQRLKLYSETPRELDIFIASTSFSETLTHAEITVMFRENADLPYLAPTLATIGRDKSFKSLVSRAQEVVLAANSNEPRHWVEMHAFEEGLNHESNATNFRLQVDLRVSPSSLLPNFFITFFTNMFQWQSPCKLSLAGVNIKPSPLLVETLATTFGGLATIRTLRVGPISAESVVDALLFRPPGRSTFPGLETLIMTNVIFHPDERVGPNVEAIDINTLISCINIRKERGVALKEVHFQQCQGIRLQDTTVLKDIIDKVVFNGKYADSISEGGYVEVRDPNEEEQ